MNGRGLTLIEILVALTVFAIGATAIAGLQISTLQLTAQTQLQTRLLHVAESELKQRLLVEPSGVACTALPVEQLEGLDCHTSETTCAVGFSGFDCAAGVTGPVRQVTGTGRRAADAEGPQVTLSSSTRVGSGP